MLVEDKPVKITTDFKLNLKTKEATDKVNKARDKGLLDSLVDIVGDVIKGSPIKTGHNRRSIAYKLGGKVTQIGRPRAGEKPFEKGEPELKKGEAAVYSTSGYGGILETGSVKMAARPYFKPALDKNIKKLPAGIKAHLA